MHHIGKIQTYFEISTSPSDFYSKMYPKIEKWRTLGILNFMFWIFDTSVCKYCNCKPKLDKNMKVVIEISRDFILSIFGLFYEDESDGEIERQLFKKSEVKEKSWLDHCIIDRVIHII